MKAWLEHHAHSLRVALGRFRDAPLAALFTVLVMGVAITLPAGLYVLMHNLQQAAGGLTPQAEVSVFFKLDATEQTARRLAAELQAQDEVAGARFVSREAALERMRGTGLGEIAASLEENPLPHAVVVTSREADPGALSALAERMRRHPEVDRVSLDSDWARRLAALLRLAGDAVWALAALLGLALAAIAGNTIRLQIYAQREEIEVARLIGATDRFIRRPFLYFGALQGLFGGLAAWLLIGLLQRLMQGSVAELAAAYGSRFQLAGLGLQEGALLLGVSALLGLAGAWFAVIHTQRALNIP